MLSQLETNGFADAGEILDNTIWKIQKEFCINYLRYVCSMPTDSKNHFQRTKNLFLGAFDRYSIIIVDIYMVINQFIRVENGANKTALYPLAFTGNPPNLALPLFIYPIMPGYLEIYQHFFHS